MKRNIMILLLAVLMIGAIVMGAYPDKPITLVVPWSAGGVTDRVARVLAPIMEQEIGESITVFNQSGASGAIGTDYVLKKPADGYTILFSAETPGIFQVMGISTASFADFDPIVMISQDTKVVVVPKNSPYDTFEELVEAIKENPGKIKLSYSGPGASGHIQGLLFNQIGLEVNAIPFGGGAPAMTATIGGQVDFTFGNVGTTLQYILNGDLKALAVFSPKPVEILPEVPSMVDTLPELEPYLLLRFPNCLLVKKGTSDEVKETILEAALAAMETDTWKNFCESNNYETLSYLQGEAVAEYWADWTSLSAWLLDDAGATQKSPAEFGIKRLGEE
mgnify:CR=1 FL=1